MAWLPPALQPLCTLQTSNSQPTRGAVQALNDGLVAAIRLLSELGAALVAKGLMKGAAENPRQAEPHAAVPAPGRRELRE